jgi:beta-glucanase (GH16 family)
MLGADNASASWPACGEIDIMENVGKEPLLIHGTLHGPGYSGGSALGAASMLANNAAFADDFHLFAIEWQAAAIRFYIDDKLYATLVPADLPKGKAWVCDDAFFVLLNLAVDGQWPGAPDSTTEFPQTLTVDYVRVYGEARFDNFKLHHGKFAP